MISIGVKSGNLDRSLKTFKKKFDKSKVLKEIRRRQFFMKKSVKRRNQIKKAHYTGQYLLKRETV